MANATVNLRFTKSGYVNKDTPYTVIPTNANTLYDVTAATKFLYLGMEKMPNNLRHNALISACVTIAVKGYGYLYLDKCNSDFDPQTLTYNNAPSVSNITVFGFPSDVMSDSLHDVTSHSNTYAYLIKEIFEYRAFQVNANSSGGRYPGVKTVLANGTALPYVTITYDDSTKIRSKISYSSAQLSGTISNAAAKTLAWELVKDTSAVDGYCAEEVWDQASAVFKYRVQGQSTWQTKNVSGNVKSVTLPAYTFLPGQTYEYQITVTDEDGTVSSTSVYTFATAATQVTPTNAPTSGYANPRNDITFSWTYQSAAGGTVNAGATTLHWRVSGSENWTDVSAASGVTSVTIPANTFPVASTIEWYLSGADSTGYASQTSVYSFSTAASLITTDPVYPKDSIESDNAPIMLTWTYSSPDGRAPSRQVVMWKELTDESWTSVATLYNGETSYEAPANTFPVGEITWCVYPYNIDDILGTGNTATFICYGAPDAPVVYATETPFMTVEWQAEGQQSYEIRIGDRHYGPYFGSEKTFAVPDYFEDGEYTVEVRIVGTYGLWSEWGSAIVSISNVPGSLLRLDGDEDADHDSQLVWETSEETSDFFLYRDGVQIAHTNENFFIDRFASGGDHEYFVVNKLLNNNYTKSNEVSITTRIETSAISALNDADWMWTSIKYTLKDQSDPEYSYTRQVFYDHLSGRTFPSAILSGYREMDLTYSAVFLYTEEEERKRFESLFGKEVVLKVNDGTILVGVLDSISKSVKVGYYTAYTFTIHRIEWEDYIDDTGDTL